MSQFPPQQPPMGYPGGAAPAPTKTSGSAIASLIFSLVGFCVPGAGLIGAIFGVLGISKTKDPRYTGRGLAIAGLIIGLLTLIGWGTMGGGIWALIKGTAPQRDMSKAFIQDLANGNVQAAQQKCTSDISLPSLTANSVTMKAWGGLKDTTFLGFKDESSTGAGRHTVVTGTATFNNGTTKGVVVELVKEGEVWKIKSFALQ